MDPDSEPSRAPRLIALVGFAVLAAVTLTRARPPRGFVAGGQLAWGTTTNRTGDARLAPAALGAIDIALSQTGALRLAADRASPGGFHLDLVVEPAERGVRLLGIVRDATANEVDTVATVTAPFLAAVDGVADRVRVKFGEGRTERARASVVVSRLGSGSIDALAAYGEALRARARGADSDAVAAGRRAIAADSGFAQAWLLAGLAALGTRNPDGELWIARGKDLLGRGPRKGRLY